MRYVILCAILLITAGCKLEPLKIDPCTVLPKSLWGEDPTCFAVPLNQPDKPEYDRVVIPGDICVSSTEYQALQNSYREILDRCAEKCK